MQNEPTPAPAARPRFAWRALTSVLISLAFLILLVSGIILFVSPPGRVANWTNWAILSLTKKDWTALHIWFSVLFLAVTVVHLVFNWRPLLSYFKDRLTRRIGFRWEWVVALAICGAVFAGTRANVPPFSSFLAFNERVKEGWDQAQGRAPIPHAELLTLSELAAKAGVEMAQAASRLQAKGVVGVTPEIVVQNLADQNHRSAQQIYEILAGNPAAKEKGEGKGGGPGWKTLAQFCADEGLDLKAVQSRLAAKGIKAAPEQTLREIAVGAGFARPYELLEVLRAKAP